MYVTRTINPRNVGVPKLFMHDIVANLLHLNSNFEYEIPKIYSMYATYCIVSNIGAPQK